LGDATPLSEQGRYRCGRGAIAQNSCRPRPPRRRSDDLRSRPMGPIRGPIELARADATRTSHSLAARPDAARQRGRMGCPRSPCRLPIARRDG
jgi:hypothetical protein